MFSAWKKVLTSLELHFRHYEISAKNRCYKISKDLSDIRFPQYISTNNFLEVEKKFQLLMQSWRFFSSDLLVKISNFSKTTHMTFIKFDIHSTPKIALACILAAKSKDCDLRKIAKISPTRRERLKWTLYLRLKKRKTFFFEKNLKF